MSPKKSNESEPAESRKSTATDGGKTVRQNTPNTIQSTSAIGSIATFMSSPGAKFVLLGAIIFMLLIPTLMVWALVEDRASRARVVANEIAQGWGDTQIINGPYLVIPYTRLEKISQTNNNGELQERLVTRNAIISPEQITVNGNIDVEERRKSIYKTQLFHLKSGIEGNFSKLDLTKIINSGGTPQTESAFLVIGVSDPTGFRSNINLKINGTTGGKFLPGLNGVDNPPFGGAYKNSFRNSASGVHLPLNESQVRSGFRFAVDFAINGSQNLTFVPAGKTTKLDLKSNWPHPGFNGKFLPETRDVNDDGFSATWTIPDLARGISEVQLSSSLPQAGSFIGVSFVEPLSFYQITSRSLKYAIGFFSLVFLAVFILELYGKSRLHWIQYILTGLAMIVFYVLLLALAEQVGFTIAYLAASIATTGLIAWYVGDALGNKNGSLIVGGVLATTYLVMYMILNQETYALLAGSLIAFIAIAATMFATRNIDWTGKTAVAKTA